MNFARQLRQLIRQGATKESGGLTSDTEQIDKKTLISVVIRYFQHAHFIPLVGVGKRGAY